MRILIRCDIGAEHGMGHATRCMALAQTLQAHGAEVCFVTSTEALVSFVAPFRCYLTDTWQRETVLCVRGDILIVDTKAPDWANDPSALWLARDAGLRVVRIDHPHAAPDTCDVLVIPNAHQSLGTVARLQRDFGERLLMGWDYVMFDDAVTQQAPVPYDERDGSIVFCAGGSDPSGALEQMYLWTKDRLPEVRKVFCVGAAYKPHGDGMFFFDRGDVAVVRFAREHLRNASLVVTMFGQTCYECLWYRTPVLCLARTQDDVLDIVGLGNVSRQAVSYGGVISKIDAEQLQWYFEAVRDDRTLLQQQYNASANLFDGRGVQRIADAILRLAQ